MYFTTAFVTTLMATTASAAAMSAQGAVWTLNHLSRNCTEDNSECLFKFNIMTDSSHKTYCEHKIKASASNPAQHAHGNPQLCGDKGQFRIESTFYAVDDAGHDASDPKAYRDIGVAYPDKMALGVFRYYDDELENGDVVDPDKQSKWSPLSAAKAKGASLFSDN